MRIFNNAAPFSAFLPLRLDLPAQADPKEVLATIHPELANRLVKLLHQAREAGLHVMLWEGFRNGKRQNQLFEQGATLARAGESFHNYGLAADVVFIDKSGRPSWALSHDWKRLGALGKSLGLIWGGDFRSLKDLGHFEYHPNLSLRKTRAFFLQGGVDRLWNEIR